MVGSVYDLSPRCPLGEVEDFGEFVLGVGGFGEHPAGFGAAAGGGVDQDGFLDAGELVEQFPHRQSSSSRTDRCSPACSDSRRIRWAICRARTQVKVWTRMLCSVQWCIGENETTWGSLSWRKLNSASDWERSVSYTHLTL